MDLSETVAAEQLLPLAALKIRAFGRLTANVVGSGTTDVILVYTGSRPLLINYHAVWTTSPCCGNFRPEKRNEQLGCACGQVLRTGLIVSRIAQPAASVTWLTSWLEFEGDNVLDASLEALAIWSDLHAIWDCTLEELDRINEGLAPL